MQENDWDTLLTEVNVATMQAGGNAYGGIENAALAIRDGNIAWVGRAADLPKHSATETRSLGGRWLTPALIDCHTHLVFGGNRAAEFEQRLHGASYEEIARAGGGIMSTVAATRNAGEEELLELSGRRLNALKREGVGTVEIKSGYGLNLDTELCMLRTARSLGERFGITVKTTFLGAHTVPVEFEGRPGDYIDYLCNVVLPVAVEQDLVDAVDGYCERIAFTPRQIAQVFECAASFDLPVKLHADQLSDAGGAELAAQFHALSADHLEYASDSGLRLLAGAGTVAVLLPGAYLVLRETRPPPVQRLRELKVPIAIGSDCNPGTSPVCSIRATMMLAGALFRLTPEECLAGVTREAARALGLTDRGTLAPGKRADIAIWNVGHPRELSYWLGLNELEDLLIGGEPLTDAPPE
jgi:imidazolonepropionase